MALIFGDRETIADDKREVAYAEAGELLEAALDKYRSLNFDAETIGRNVMWVFNEGADSVLDTFKFEEGVKACMRDIWSIEEVTTSE